MIPNLPCAQCGGQVAPDAENPFISCPYCGSTLYLDGAWSCRHLGMPARCGRSVAADLFHEDANRGYPPTSSPEITSIVLPFWSLRSANLQATVPAFSPVPLSLLGFKLPATQAAWFCSADYPDFSIVDPSAETRLAWEEAAGTVVSLYSVPFYRLRYGAGGRYETWVDGSSARIFRGMRPPEGMRAASRHFARTIGLLVGICALEAFVLPGGWLALGAVSLTVGLAYPWVKRNIEEGDPP